jgi:magnesium-transporting ATPase (P-type)
LQLIFISSDTRSQISIDRRRGEERLVDATQVVPGDLVLLESGDRVPADLRLLEGTNLTIDESFLTGENIPPAKQPGLLAEDTPLGDRTNMAFAGSKVMSGRALGVTAVTAMQTQVGRIAASVAFAESAKPPLVQRMETFTHQLSIVVLGAVLLLALVGLSKGMPAVEVFFMAVALAVSAIPEGLPIAMTVVLSIAVKRMAQRGVIVRKLPAVEGLGSCTCIASDKTGTLTVNQQTVKIVATAGGAYVGVSGQGYDPVGETYTVSDPSEATDPARVPSTRVMAAAEHADGVFTAPLSGLQEPDRQHLLELGRAGILCNESTFRAGPDGTWEHHSDAMDVALLVFGAKLGLDLDAERQAVQILGAIPYESENQFAAQFYRRAGSVRAAVKGAVEKILPFCDHHRLPGGERKPIAPLDVEAEALRLAEAGYRVLAVAEGEPKGSRRGPDDDNTTTAWAAAEVRGLDFLGLVGFLDPLRSDVKVAVDKCRQAGIRVIMITGDHPATALAIARELGIANYPSDVVTGMRLTEIGSIETPEFFDAVTAGRVFARITPLQKLEIVEALIKAGHFVAVTGDGVNDAPALKRANIGIAMGSGTEVAKDTAEIIVTDDAFSSIEGGVEEGRFAYDNVRKVTSLLVSCGLAEVLLFTLSLLAGMPLPISAVQLLWLNLVTNGIQDVALAFEGGEPGTMNRPPRALTEGIFNRLMISQTAVAGIAMGLLAFFAWRHLQPLAATNLAAARNDLLILMVLMQNIHVFSCRSEYESAFRIPLSRNVILVFGVLLAQGIHIACMHIPLAQRILGTNPISWGEWAAFLGLAFVMLIVMEVFKALPGPREKVAVNH